MQTVSFREGKLKKINNCNDMRNNRIGRSVVKHFEFMLGIGAITAFSLVHPVRWFLLRRWSTHYWPLGPQNGIVCGKGNPRLFSGKGWWNSWIRPDFMKLKLLNALSNFQPIRSCWVGGWLQKSRTHLGPCVTPRTAEPIQPWCIGRLRTHTANSWVM